MRIKIPMGDCHSCRFFSETEDGNMFCAIYNKYWDLSDEEAELGEPNPPDFCNAIAAEIIEVAALPERTAREGSGGNA